MTISGFIKKLKKTPGPWTLNGGGSLRCQGTCPIVAVAGHHGLAWWMFNDKLGLDNRLAGPIVEAADNVETSYPDLRQRLLAATVERTK